LSALSHPVLRLFYIFAYVFDVPLARGLLWAFGLLTTIILYKEAIFQVL